MRRHIAGDAFTRCVRRPSQGRRAPAFHGDEKQRGHGAGGGGASACCSASGAVRPPHASGRARGPGRAAGAGGCGATQSRCAVFHLEQGHGGQGPARASVPRGRPRRARAPAARRSRHDALRRHAARHRQSSEHRGAHVQPRGPAFAPLARHGRRLRAHQ